MLPTKVKIVEVGPRDGLQNEKQQLDVSTKVEFINKLSQTGLCDIEVGSFVSPEKIPQMSNTDKVLSEIKRFKGIKYSTLVPNRTGIDKAIKYQPDYVSVFTAVSNQFCLKNINCTIDESIARFKEVCEVSKQYSIPVRGYISCVLGCPYEGEIDVHKAVELASTLINLGCYEVSLGDTIGIGNINQVQRLIAEVNQAVALDKIAVHFHDTYGQALVNVYAALQMGVSIIDSAVAGLGGCPYAKGAAGNLATDDLVYMLNGLGIDSGVDLEKLLDAGHYICKQLNIPPRSKLSLAKLKD